MNHEKTIELLNKLVEINNDRIEGYETASKETKEGDLKGLFASFIGTSRSAKKELVEKVVNFGGTPAEGTKVSGKFFRKWMDLKAALTDKDRKAILGSCEFGEDAAIDTYDKVLAEKEITASTFIPLIEKQREAIRKDHDRIKMMRDQISQR